MIMMSFFLYVLNNMITKVFIEIVCMNIIQEIVNAFKLYPGDRLVLIRICPAI